MINNPAQNIHTDYATDDVFKPQDANALVQSVPYDYIITDEMLEAYYEEHGVTDPSMFPVDVAELFGVHYPETTVDSVGIERKSKISVMIAAHTTYDNRFDFQTGFPPFFSASFNPDQELHVYSRAPWTLCRGFHHAAVFIHSHGETSCVALDCANDILSGQMPMSVGSYRTDMASTPLVWGNSAKFTFECLIAGDPITKTSNPYAIIEKRAWLSNATGGDSGVVSDRMYLVDTKTPDWYNDRIGKSLTLTKNNFTTNLTTMPTALQPLDISGAVSLDWYTWDIVPNASGHTATANTNTGLYIDSDSVREGVVYEVGLHIMNHHVEGSDRRITVDNGILVPPSRVSSVDSPSYKIAFYQVVQGTAVPQYVYEWSVDTSQYTTNYAIEIRKHWNIPDTVSSTDVVTLAEIAWGRALFTKIGSKIVILKYSP